MTEVSRTLKKSNVILVSYFVNNTNEDHVKEDGDNCYNASSGFDSVRHVITNN